MSHAPAFGRWLKQRRHALDLTQDALAEQVGCSAETIRKLEAERARASRHLAQRLAEQLALAPEEQAEFVELARRVGTVDAVATGGAVPQLVLPTPRVRVPAPTTPLLGRERELASLIALLLRPEVRLLTLSGAGGVGKTRLALAIAADARADFPDGVFFVPLASIRDPELTITTIARALGLLDAGERPLDERLHAHVRDKQLLLLLDNFEHLLPAVSVVATLLAAGPHLKVMVTSRAILHLSGEYVFPVPALALPESGVDAPPDEISRSAAIRLFVERARAADPAFALTPENAPAVVEICRRLDGLPLAIELAAARSRLLPPLAMVARLERRLPLLTGGARDRPERQQTIRSTIGWSYDLLAAEEQQLFARLAVFVGGWRIEAAEAVACALLSPVAKVLDSLQSLLDKSLVEQVTDPDGMPRFNMLETIREYALERLVASGEEVMARHAHLAYYLALAEAAAPNLTGAGQERWLQRLETERDDLRQALQWSLEQDDATTALRLGGALWRFWYVRAHFGEGRRWLAQALATNDGATAPLRLHALTGAGVLAHYQGDFSRAAGLFGESLLLARQLDDQAGSAEALQGLALVARAGGNFAAARAMYTEALAILRPLGDRGAVAHTLTYQGVAAWMQADYAAAHPLADEGLAIYRELGDPQGIATAANIRGFVAAAEHDDALAHGLQRESLLLYRQLGDRRGSAKALSGLGDVAFNRGDYALARALYQESLANYLQVGDMWCTVETLELLARVAAVEGQPTTALRDALRAVQIYGAAEELRTALGAPMPPHHRTAYHAPILAATRARLGEDAFAAAWTAGGTLSLEQAIALATAAQGHMPVPEGARPAPVDDAGGTPVAAGRGRLDSREALVDLSAREREVLRLVAEGLTDAQVAEHLTISPRTVQRHLSAIYSKLHVTSRTAAARRALDQGLA